MFTFISGLLVNWCAVGVTIGRVLQRRPHITGIDKKPWLSSGIVRPTRGVSNSSSAPFCSLPDRTAANCCNQNQNPTTGQ